MNIVLSIFLCISLFFTPYICLYLNFTFADFGLHGPYHITYNFYEQRVRLKLQSLLGMLYTFIFISRKISFLSIPEMLIACEALIMLNKCIKQNNLIKTQYQWYELKLITITLIGLRHHLWLVWF